ncbi:MAG TPA: hypothetical protein VF719_03750 [Abditibacteriaceae bacterium]
MKKKRIAALIFVFVTAVAGVVGSAMFVLPRSIECLFLKFYHVDRPQGFSAIFVREVGLRGENSLALSVHESGRWISLGYIEDTEFGKSYPGAAWSKDNTVLVAQECIMKGHLKFLFGYDFKTRTRLQDELAVTRALKTRGGLGKQIFCNVDEFNKVARHPWFWELESVREKAEQL